MVNVCACFIVCVSVIVCVGAYLSAWACVYHCYLPLKHYHVIVRYSVHVTIYVWVHLMFCVRIFRVSVYNLLW